MLFSFVALKLVPVSVKTVLAIGDANVGLMLVTVGVEALSSAKELELTDYVEPLYVTVTESRLSP